MRPEVRILNLYALYSHNIEISTSIFTHSLTKSGNKCLVEKVLFFFKSFSKEALNRLRDAMRNNSRNVTVIFLSIQGYLCPDILFPLLRAHWFEKLVFSSQQ